MFGTRKYRKKIFRKITTSIQDLDKDYFRDGFRGDDRAIMLGMRNLFFPEKFIEKIRYNQVLPLPSIFTKSKPLPEHDKSSAVMDAVNTLRRDGILILPSYAVKAADFLTAKYGLTPTKEKYGNNYGVVNDNAPDPVVVDYLADPFLLSVVGEYQRVQPFLRMVPAVCEAYSSVNTEEVLAMQRENYTGRLDNNVRFNVPWHFDTVNLINIHLLLNDVPPTGTRMLYAKGSHKKHHLNLSDDEASFSEKYVRDHYEIVDCAGPRGTAVIFDANGIHRMSPEKGAYRAFYGQMITPGNNVIDIHPLDIPENTLAHMSSLQRNYFSRVLRHEAK